MFAALAPAARAADGTWTNAAGGNWSVAGNWTGSVIADGAAATANFATLDPTADVAVQLDAPRTIGNLIFGDTDTATAASWTLGNNGNVANVLVLSGATPTITVNALGSGKTGAISAAIQGSAGLTKTGTGTLTLSGANSFSGTRTVSAGTLNLRGNQSAATGSIAQGTSNASTATLNIGSGSQTAATTVAVGAGGSVQAGAIGSFTGTAFQSLTVAGTSSFPTSVTNSGTLAVGRNASLTINSSATWTQSGAINIQAVGGYGATVTVATGGSLIHTGTGATQLTQTTGVSSHSTLSIAGGTFTTGQSLNFNGSSGTTSVGRILLSNNGTLRLSASPAQLLTGDSSGKVELTGTGGVIDTNGFVTSIDRPLAGAGSMTKSGAGTLTLAGANLFTGLTRVNGGTLALAASGSLAADSSVSIAAGATFDVSQIASYTLGAGASLTATGSSTQAALLAGGTAMDLGTRPVTLDFTPTTFNGDAMHPALRVLSGALTLNGPVTVTNSGASPLGDGVYVLASPVGGNISGAPVLSGAVGGQGIAVGRSAYLQMSGGNLEIVVHPPVQATTTTLQRHVGTNATSTYGDAVSFDVFVSPATATGAVELHNGGTLIGTGTLVGGACTITPAETALAVGSHANLVARHLGNPAYLASDSAPLAPAQSVAAKALTISGAVAFDKYYDATTAATLGGTLTGVETGDTVTLTLEGNFASAGPGTNIAVTSTSTLGGASAANYSLVQPTGLNADIIAANVWTGGAGGAGTSLATGTNFSPTATPNVPFTAIFNGLDPATTDLTLPSTIGGSPGTAGMTLGFANAQTNPVTITGSAGMSMRIARIYAVAGTGAVTLQGTLQVILGGLSTASNHLITNASTNPMIFQSGITWSAGGGNTRALRLDGDGDVEIRGNIAPGTASAISLTKSGAGTLTLTGANTFSGGLTHNTGTLIAGSASALGAGAVVNHGTLNLTAGPATYTGLSSNLSGSGVVNVTLGTGSGSTLLNGNFSAFTGNWNVGVGATAGAGKVQMNGADNAAATIQLLPHATLFTSTGTHTAALILGGGDTGESLGQLRLAGNAVWAGNVTLTGDITGTGDGSIGANTNSTGTILGNIGESGGPRGLSKCGNGMIILTGSSTFTGPTTVLDGTLLVNAPGSLAPASTVTVASGAVLGGSGTIGGSVVVQAGGLLQPDLAAPVVLTVESDVTLGGTLGFAADRSASPVCGQLDVGGTLALGGTLTVANVGAKLKLGDRLQLFNAATITGTFAQMLLPPLGYDLKWNTSQLATGGYIEVVSAAGEDHPTITLTPGSFHQQIRGIGGNFAQGEQGTLVAYERYDELFGPNGLNMSFIRLGTTLEMTAPLFANMDANNLTTIAEFRARQPNGRVALTAWSPPELLKSTASAFQGTIAKDGSNQYRYADYAAWWTRVLQYYQAASALPNYVSIQNEPDFTPSGTTHAYESGCYLNSTETSTKAGYPQALAAVKSAFTTAGFGTMKMIGPDTTAIAGNKIPDYLNNLPAGSINAIGHHLYHDSPATTGAPALATLQTQYPWWNWDKFMTELNPHDQYESWPAGQPGWMQLAATIHNIFTIECANSYMVWSSMWGFIDRVTGLPNNNNYYALGHFSRFINASNWRVASSSDDADVAVSHYRHYGGPGITDRQIVVLINKSGVRKHATIGTAASWSATPAQRSWQVYRTADDGSERPRLALVEFDQGPQLSGNRTLVLPPYSLTTALINTGIAATAYTNQQAWRFTHFGSMDNTGPAADNEDPNNDGESNLYEFATNQDPFATTLVTPGMEKNSTALEFTYTRAKAALADGVTFTVEWSDTLAPGSWSSAGVTEQILTDNGTVQAVKASVAAGAGGRRFVHLTIFGP